MDNFPRRCQSEYWALGHREGPFSSTTITQSEKLVIGSQKPTGHGMSASCLFCSRIMVILSFILEPVSPTPVSEVIDCLARHML